MEQGNFSSQELGVPESAGSQEISGTAVEQALYWTLTYPGLDDMERIEALGNIFSYGAQEGLTNEDLDKHLSEIQGELDG